MGIYTLGKFRIYLYLDNGWQYTIFADPETRAERIIAESHLLYRPVEFERFTQAMFAAVQHLNDYRIMKGKPLMRNMDPYTDLQRVRISEIG